MPGFSRYFFSNKFQHHTCKLVSMFNSSPSAQVWQQLEDGALAHDPTATQQRYHQDSIDTQFWLDPQPGKSHHPRSLLCMQNLLTDCAPVHRATSFLTSPQKVSRLTVPSSIPSREPLRLTLVMSQAYFDLFLLHLDSKTITCVDSKSWQHHILLRRKTLSQITSAVQHRSAASTRPPSFWSEICKHRRVITVAFLSSDGVKIWRAWFQAWS